MTDRYGRIVADALVTRDGYPGSAEKTLLSQGLARVSARLPEPGCLAELRAAERVGRAAKLGLWADPRYLPKQAENVAGLSAERGRFTLVEGKVASVRESGGTIYVNFGRRWSEDFTVTILKRNERQFIDAGLRPSGLSGPARDGAGVDRGARRPVDRGHGARADRDHRGEVSGRGTGRG